MSSQRGFYDHGGSGPTILLVHGLMGNGHTWFEHVPWLKRYGRVFTFDAAYHQGNYPNNLGNSADSRSDHSDHSGHSDHAGYSGHSDNVDRSDRSDHSDCGSHNDPDSEPINIDTERFVADIAELLFWIDRGPAILIGHSMGALHAWCTASTYPELVSALVIEEMVPQFCVQDLKLWVPYFLSWPVPFSSLEHTQDYFGSIAGKYFWTAFEKGAPHGSMDIWMQIAAAWGDRDFWHQWESVDQPTLLIQGEKGIDANGLMGKMAQNPAVKSHVIIPNAGHLVHDEKVAYFRGAVEAFLAGLPNP